MSLRAVGGTVTSLRGQNNQLTTYLPAPSFSGGTIGYVGNDVIHTFTSSGTLTPLIAGPITVRALVVAGGGGGALATDRTAGGGGAGGVLESSSLAISTIQTITVGAGGAIEANGDNSSIGSLIVSIGGGRGARATLATAGSGGSGGGRYHSNGSVAGSGTVGQGNAGGDGYDSGSGTGNFGAGGGGGASAVGGNAQAVATGAGSAGVGGAGRASDISGTSVYYGGGGGGAAQDNSVGSNYYVGGSGGIGGGGAGATTGGAADAQVNGVSGAANTGGGGGGGRSSFGTAGVGGSGTVIIRYTPTQQRAVTRPAVHSSGLTALGVVTSDPTTDLDAFLTASQQTNIATWMTFVPNNGTFTLALSNIATVNARFGRFVPLELGWSFPGTSNLAGIAAGNDDAYIIARAHQLRDYGGPVYLRLNWEMNGDWYTYAAFNPDGSTRPGNAPSDYVAAWRRIFAIVRPIAPNAAFVWCPHLWLYHNTPTSDYYPGKAYVDWIGVTAYPGSAVWSYIQDGEWGLRDVADLANASGRPMRICEWGVGQGGSENDVGIFYQFKDWLAANPVVREIVYFHMNGLNGVNYRLGNYADWQFAYRNEMTGHPERFPQS